MLPTHQKPFNFHLIGNNQQYLYSEANILSRVQKKDRKAQQTLYDKYAPLFFAICLRYVKEKMSAEDVMITSFHKIFTKIDQYKNQGSFEGWMKRIVINESLMHLRKHKSLNLHVDMEKAPQIKKEAEVLDELFLEDMLRMLEELPTGYRTVFNLYVIEGYKHREIAELLGISINTSKSQLILAKRKFKELYKKKQNNSWRSGQV